MLLKQYKALRFGEYLKMAILLRIDVDAPYTTETFLKNKLCSLCSNYYFPRIRSLGYLTHLDALLNELNKRDIKATFFFKRNTLPSKDQLKSLESHEIALHMLNTNNIDSVARELRLLGERKTR